MKAVTTALTLAAVCSVLTVGCGGGKSGPDLSDEALAREVSQKMYGKSLDEAATGHDAAKQAIVSNAVQTCSTLRTMRDGDVLSTDPSYPGNATAIGALEVQFAKSSAWTAQQTQDSLLIIARYKCDEFSSMLRVYDATH